MATVDEINTRELPSFSKLKPYEQLAIVLRAEGRTTEEIINTINAEYNLAYKPATAWEWFMAGGRLEQAYFEYTEASAEQAIKLARAKLKKATDMSADTLITLQGEGYESNVRLGAAKAVLAKYIPDKQVVIGATQDDDLPPELANAGDDIMKGDNGSNPVDDAPESEPASPESGD